MVALIELVLTAVDPELSVVTLVELAPPPTAPANTVRPAVVTAKARAVPSKLSTVEPKVISPEAELVNVTVAAFSFAASLKVCAPVVLMSATLNFTVPGASVVRLVSGVVPPTTPVNSVNTLALIVSPKAPLTVESKFTFAPVNAELAVRVTAVSKSIVPALMTGFELIAPVPPSCH